MGILKRISIHLRFEINAKKGLASLDARFY